MGKKLRTGSTLQVDKVRKVPSGLGQTEPTQSAINGNTQKRSYNYV